jgi:hypothetical protein
MLAKLISKATTAIPTQTVKQSTLHLKPIQVMCLLVQQLNVVMVAIHSACIIVVHARGMAG